MKKILFTIFALSAFAPAMVAMEVPQEKEESKKLLKTYVPAHQVSADGKKVFIVDGAPKTFNGSAVKDLSDLDEQNAQVIAISNNGKHVAWVEYEEEEDEYYFYKKPFEGGKEQSFNINSEKLVIDDVRIDNEGTMFVEEECGEISQVNFEARTIQATNKCKLFESSTSQTKNNPLVDELKQDTKKLHKMWDNAHRDVAALKNFILKIGIPVTIFVAAVGALGVYLWKKNKKNDQETDEVTPETEGV